MALTVKPIRTADTQGTYAMTQLMTNEQQYKQWLDAHPDGFVLNTTKGHAPEYMVLHRATCRYIAEPMPPAQPGGFTERDYVKVVDDEVTPLRHWVAGHG